MEDLPGRALHEILQSADAAKAEAALMAFAGAFGVLHRHTARDGPTLTMDAEGIGTSWGFTLNDVVSVRANALAQIDAGPDNCMIADGAARLFDFEIAAEGAALSDVVLWRMGFPNCGASAGAIPAALLRRMEEAYGEVDPVEYGRAYTWILLQRLDRYHAWKVLEEDWVWAHASGRQRVLTMLRRCPESAPLADEFARLHERLRSEWPDTPDSLPTYPALRAPS